jgi:hypothetical protein
MKNNMIILLNFDILFHNDQAERDIRMTKVNQ